MGDEECAEEKDQRDPSGEEEGNGGQDVYVMRQVDEATRGDLEKRGYVLSHTVFLNARTG